MADAVGAARSQSPARAADPNNLGTPLHYTARAGLLAELSRQTYDSLYKALREAILNGIDAGASRVDLDFGRDGDNDELLVADDGEGMDLDGLRQSFMSLGGSQKFNDATKFGRIGIGSLALLTYAREAIIETKRADSDALVRAHLFHPQTLDREERAQVLEQFPAGVASEEAYGEPSSDHFTRIRLKGLAPEVRAAIDDPNEFYALLDRLRRVLPLPLRSSRLLDVLERDKPELVAMLRAYADDWSVPVHVTSAFHQDLELTRRTYGDGEDEAWSGPIYPLSKTLRIVRPGERREILVAGFLISQQRAVPAWSGVTARVQNVAVEEGTFFEVTADPGFRKYIAGEVFLLGDVDTDRLININRTSFNREARDYRLVQRFVAGEIESFKRHQVARPQRQKVGLRKLLEDYRELLAGIGRVLAAADRQIDVSGSRGLPSSRNGSLAGSPRADIRDVLKELGVRAMVDATIRSGSPYRIDRTEGAEGLTVRLSPAFAEPCADVAGTAYRLSFRRGRATGPPLIVKNRPREIVMNVAHPAVGESFAGGTAPFALALELGYLLRSGDHADDLYDRILGLAEAL